MRRFKGIYPGDPIYYDDKGKMFKKAGKGRIYLGQSSLSNTKPMKEGRKVVLK